MDLHQGVATKALDITAAITKGVDSAAVAVFVEDPGVEAFADFAAVNTKCYLIWALGLPFTVEQRSLLKSQLLFGFNLTGEYIGVMK